MALSKDNIINLEDFRVVSKDGKKAKIFTGRDRGEDVRTNSRLDELERIYDKIQIVIPDNVYSINPSFFEELFINVLLKLGKEKFLEKFTFVSEGNYNYEKPLAEAIVRVLRSNTAIG